MRDHDDFLVAPGTTTFLVGRILSGITDRSFRIITPSLELALETSGVANIRTVVLGGEVRGTYVTGFEAGHEYFHGCHREHTLLMSVDGLSASGSLTVFESSMVPVLKEMMAVAGRTILVLDSSKLGRAMFAPVARVGDVSLVVTDCGASERMRRVIRDSGAQLVCV